MKSIENLIRFVSKNQGQKTVGNHAAFRNGSEVKFTYHGNTVCRWDMKKNKFVLDDCGWKGYSSTTRTLNDYRFHLSHYFGATERTA